MGIIREGRLLPWNNDAELCCWYSTQLKEKFMLMTDELNNKGYHAIYYSSNGSICVKRKNTVVNINIYWQEDSYAVRPHELPSISGPIISRILYWFSVFIGSYPKGLFFSKAIHLSFRELIKIFIIFISGIFSLNTRKKLINYCIFLSKNTGGVYQKTAIPAKYFEEFEMLKFYGSKVRAPTSSQELIEFIYGKYWNIPLDDWSFYSDKNKSKTGIKFIDQIWNYSEMDIV